tara:strand:+ start:1978 stop:2970 length:993 start_codon:yes stop_codon:yes gene_type:complete
MADLKKFEQMLERLVNEDKEGAEELFHEIVVEKSREIYESLLETDLEDDEEVDEATDEEVDESDDEELDEADDEDLDEADDEELDENFNLDEFEVEADPMDAMMGGDPADSMMGDVEMPDMGDEEGEEGEGGDMEDRVMDLEDALEDLKAEFDALMAGDDGDMDGEEEPEMDMGADMDDEEGDMDDEEGEEPEEESFQATVTPMETKYKKTAGEQMREYVEKVSASMGDNGANTKSIMAKPNNMGGTSANIAKGTTEQGVEAAKGNLKGSALSDQNPKDMSTGNVNVPGGKAAKAGKTVPAGHGAEKKGKPETADKAATSTLNKVSSRAK